MKRIKIALDARMIDASGIGKYIQNLLKSDLYDVAIGKTDRIREFNKKIDIVKFESSIYGLKGEFLFPYSKLKKLGVSYIHFPHYNAPIFQRIPSFVTVHDLIHIIFPEFLGSKLKYYYARLLIKNALFKSVKVFTVSECSKSDIVSIFGVNPEKIVVSYIAIDDCFEKKEKSKLTYLYEKYNIPRNRKLLLYVGNLKPHKNLIRLLEAVAKIENKKPFVILVGQNYGAVDFDALLNRLSLIDDIVITGKVSDEEVVNLYNLADLFVFPSLYEGFGLPPLEAMACGTPVVASNVASIPEVVGTEVCMFNPYNVDDIANAICQNIELKTQSDYVLNYDISRFSWKKVIDSIEKIFDEFDVK